MDSKAILLVFATILILLFAATASSLDNHEELKVKVNYVKATASPPANPPTPPRTRPKPPIYKAPPSPKAACIPLCRKWCMCMRACRTGRCPCAPPGTFGNRGRCGGCNRSECPRP